MGETLIYIEEGKLKPMGGPLGYNYNLKMELDKMEGATHIHYLSTPPASRFANLKIKLSKIIPTPIKKIIIAIINYRSTRHLLYGDKHNACINLNQFDIIHFHDTRSLYSVRDDLRDYKGKIVLTSHSPTLLSLEIQDMLSSFERHLFRKTYAELIKMDEYSFSRADYIIFPCPEAEEPYVHNWAEFSKIKEIKRSHFKYLLTGIQRPHIKLTRNEICDKYHIPRSSIIISYVGRHNEIKGYDKLLEIGNRVLKEKENVYFLIAGKEGPLYGLTNPRWIEVGWTDDPHSIIAASDIFILPNKETYFDLILLEVLALGTLVVASSSGGNKFFQLFKDSGIFLYETVEQALVRIDNIILYSEQKKKRLANNNKIIFSQYFTSEQFAKNYLNLLDSL